jgi:hypothetical protein
MAKQVMYWKDMSMLLFFTHNDFKADTETIFMPIALKKDYVILPEFYHTTPEQIFGLLNSENNPMGTKENQRWIKDNGLNHTSMSIGDMIIDSVAEITIVCMPAGFKRVIWITRGKNGNKQKI